LKQTGWSAEALRRFSNLVMPSLKAKRPWGARLNPPGDLCDEGFDFHKVVHFEVQFLDRHGESVSVPSDKVAAVLKRLCAGLGRASELLSAIKTEYWHTSNFQPVGQGNHYRDEASQYLDWARELLDRLATENPELARAEVLSWPHSEQYFCAKFTIYALGIPTLFSGQQVADILTSLHSAHSGTNTIAENYCTRSKRAGQILNVSLGSFRRTDSSGTWAMDSRAR
jgi:hypothetical protein